MANSDFVMGVDPHGNKRLVPAHYVANPAFGYKLAPSERSRIDIVTVIEPEETPEGEIVREPAVADTTGEQVEEPAAADTSKTSKKTGPAGEKKEA